jgi:UrcA family protein
VRQRRTGAIPRRVKPGTCRRQARLGRGRQGLAEVQAETILNRSTASQAATFDKRYVDERLQGLKIVRMEDIMFQDLNLPTTAGVDALYQRIYAAAQRLCAVFGQTELGAASASATCTKDAKPGLSIRLNLPALKAFAANR